MRMPARYNYPVSCYPHGVVREALTEQERARGRALGLALRRLRGATTVRELSGRCGLAQETIRKIERGAVPTPALFTVAALAQALDTSLDHLVREAIATSEGTSQSHVA
jgi:transcriptional regulator with XRE-family HTH domain